ncbi:hypothetical protein VTN77DRAFT_7238 [Rasamsonia byssochlamydoides]|uniref:uncharacterized protein n=1 Tax=Rasamsonia byssochlamydoides TaxID=89139 RepID=UPI00374245EF
MVGVPRSKGCLTCLRRRVKCDELRPECSQCLKYGVSCPGYSRSMKFQDEGPLLRKRFGSRAYRTTRIKPEQPRPSDSIDERALPSLVASSMSRQQSSVFRDFVLSAFPRWFGLNRCRVKVTWATYVAEQLGRNQAFDAAIYCITCAFMGQYHDDARLRQSSWEMYAKAMTLLKDSVTDENMLKSRESVSTSILLSLFEAYSMGKDDSWARHAVGTALMMSLRGPNIHRTGFDRCLYLSFRSFLVAQALVEGKPCIFEKPEWQALIDRIRREDMNDPKADEPISVFIDISDRLFMEIAKFPGIVSEARVLMSSPIRQTTKIKLLAARIWNCREATRSLAAEMRVALSVHGYLSRLGDPGAFVGPIASTFPESFANCLLRGTDTTIAVLDLLLADLAAIEMMTTDPTAGSAPFPVLLPRAKDSRFAPVCRPFRIVSGLGGDEFSGNGHRSKCRVNEWLDLVASSMGMEGLRVVYDMSKPQTIPIR